MTMAAAMDTNELKPVDPGAIEKELQGLWRAQGQARQHDGSDGKPLGRVDLMFSHIDQNISGKQFPQENFVFTDQFRRLLVQFTQGQAS